MARDRLHKVLAKEFRDFLSLLYLFTVQLYVCLVPRSYVIYLILLCHDIASESVVKQQ